MKKLIILATLLLLGGGIRAFGQPLDARVAGVLEAIRERQVEAGNFLSHGPLTGSLGRRESVNVQIHTCSGVVYTAQGICDAGCTDFDLTALDSSALVLDEDVLADDVPVLIFTPAESGIITLSVKMVSCSTDSCDWGVQLFIDDALAPAAPGSK